MGSRLLRIELPETETALHLIGLLEQNEWEDDTYYDINALESYSLIATPFNEGTYLEKWITKAS